MNGGREGRPIGAFELAKAVEELGAGEILLNCIDCDGMNDFMHFFEIRIVFNVYHYVVYKGHLQSVLKWCWNFSSNCVWGHYLGISFVMIINVIIFLVMYVLPGQGKGFDIDLIKLISDAVSIPVIASSGAGAVEHFSDVFKETNASAALAAGIFHRKEVNLHRATEYS